jgi:hypothetical protein
MSPSRLVLASALFATSLANAADYAAWHKVNTDGSWTQAAEVGVAATQLPNLVPKDIALFCPNYESLDPARRKQFWAALLSAMARPESNFKPETKYVEPEITDATGANVTSRGLLQISRESANQKAYSCGIKQAEDLHDPSVNLACGAKIMSYWVTRENLIAAQVKPATGAARYWSVLRAWRNHLQELTGFTKSLEFCKNAS